MLCVIAMVSLASPINPLATDALEVTAQNKMVSEWSEEEQTESFELLQKVARAWKQRGIEQYMVYRHERSWEIIPYQNKSNIITRIWQQLRVLWRTTFGAPKLTEAQRQAVLKRFHALNPANMDPSPKVEDPFCDPQVIERQLVYEGKRVNVLYNYAPIGKEQLHFLIVPKEHRQKFTDLTKEEYLEAQQLSERVIRQIKKTHNVAEEFLFHKVGRDAGQTVPHWHTHVVFSASKSQTFFGKLTILKNLFFRSPPPQRQSPRRQSQQIQGTIRITHMKNTKMHFHVRKCW